MEDVINYKNRLEHEIKRIEKRIREYKQDKYKLTKHGYWSLGYWEGKLAEKEDILFFVNVLIENNTFTSKAKEIDSNSIKTISREIDNILNSKADFGLIKRI